MKNIPTHDPQTGELNPYYEELTGEKNPLSKDVENERFDIPRFVGRKFRYNGKYGLSTWTDTVKRISYRQGIVFDKPLKFKVPKKGEDFKAEKFELTEEDKQKISKLELQLKEIAQRLYVLYNK